MAKVRFGFRLGIGLWFHLREPSPRFGAAQPASPLSMSYQSINPDNGKSLKTFAELLARFGTPKLMAGNVDSEHGILSA